MGLLSSWMAPLVVRHWLFVLAGLLLSCGGIVVVDGTGEGGEGAADGLAGDGGAGGGQSSAGTGSHRPPVDAQLPEVWCDFHLGPVPESEITPASVKCPFYLKCTYYPAWTSWTCLPPEGWP